MRIEGLSAVIISFLTVSPSASFQSCFIYDPLQYRDTPHCLIFPLAYLSGKLSEMFIVC